MRRIAIEPGTPTEAQAESALVAVEHDPRQLLDDTGGSDVFLSLLSDELEATSGPPRQHVTLDERHSLRVFTQPLSDLVEGVARDVEHSGVDEPLRQQAVDEPRGTPADIESSRSATARPPGTGTSRVGCGSSWATF